MNPILKKNINDYSRIVLGSLLIATAYVFFVTPYKIVPGGVYGISIVIHYVTEGWFSIFPSGLPIGTTALVFNIPLVILAHRLLGASAIPKTIVTFASTAFFTDTLSYTNGLKQLVSGDPLLAAIYGGTLIGLGVALIFSAGSTSAGTDVISRIIAKYTNVSVGYCIVIVDSCVVLLGLIAFRDWSVPLYSWIAIFVYGKVVDIIQEGLNVNRAVFIISEKHEALSEIILKDMDRGGTFFHGQGMYEHKEKEIIYTIIPSRDVLTLRKKIHEIDPEAFITILPAFEILGKGFRPLSEKKS